VLDTTVEFMIERVKRDSSLASRGPVFTLAAQHVADTTTVQVNEDPNFGGPGSVLSMGVCSYYVQEADSTNKTFTVIPSYHGTTDETLDPPQVVYVDDPFPGGAIKDHAMKEILSWRDRLWRVETLDLDVGETNHIYDFDTSGNEVIFLLEVRHQPASRPSWWGFSWANDRWPRMPARLLRNMPVADFPSGQAIQFESRPFNAATRIAYATPFDLSAFTTTTDLVATVGLRDDWLDILEYGIRARLMSTNAISRTDWRSGGHVRRAEEVTLMDVVRAADQARVERERHLASAANMLRGEWPYRTV
jgi:hypothetical protein